MVTMHINVCSENVKNQKSSSIRKLRRLFFQSIIQNTSFSIPLFQIASNKWELLEARYIKTGTCHLVIFHLWRDKTVFNVKN